MPRILPENAFPSTEVFISLIEYDMKKLAVLLSALISLNAADLHADGTDITAGPWLQNVTETEFTVMWVTEGKCLS